MAGWIEGALPAPGPLRRLAWATLVTTIGNGAWYTTWAVLLTRSAGLSPTQVGLGITLGGVLGMALATPVGYLADRIGARRVLVWLVLLQAVGMVAYVAVDRFWLFLPVACLTESANNVKGGVRVALVSGLAADDERIAVLASLRVVNHVGVALGAVVGGVVMTLDTGPAYTGLLLLDAASYLVYALVVVGLPNVAAAAVGPSGAGLVVLRDLPYVSLAAMMGVLTLCWGMLSSGLPLWVVRHTDAPASTAAAVVVINAVAITLFQVRVARGVESPIAAARVALGAGAALALACGLFALSDGRGAGTALVLILAGGVVHVVGELLFVASSWGLSIPLMPEGAAGQYQGMFATGEAAAITAAPLIMTTLVVGWGQPGWLVLAALFLGAVAPAQPVTRWALRTRASVGVDAAR